MVQELSKQAPKASHCWFPPHFAAQRIGTEGGTLIASCSTSAILMSIPAATPADVHTLPFSMKIGSRSTRASGQCPGTVLTRLPMRDDAPDVEQIRTDRVAICRPVAQPSSNIKRSLTTVARPMASRKRGLGQGRHLKRTWLWTV